MTPKQRYALDLANGDIFPDASQEKAIEELQAVYDGLLEYWQVRKGLWQVFVHKLGKSTSKPTSGLYLWGGVGRGKTYLMDKFYHCLPGERKMRMHFHRFMQMIHRNLSQQEGQKNPLVRVAKDIANQVDVICFDEFFVTDIGDAMILGNLLEALFDKGVILIATSNIAPDLLYKDGLQREGFLPAIALLKQQTKVINMDGEIDYRLRKLARAQIFHTPLNESGERAMLKSYKELSLGQKTEENYSVEILGRSIKARFYTEGLVWFDFKALCDGPRSAADYIEIAQLFHTVLLTNIPILGASQDDEARRFISLIDEFYDHKVKMVLSAQASLDQLYQGKELLFPFERTQSRLLEMQSYDYLALEHNP